MEKKKPEIKDQMTAIKAFLKKSKKK